MMSYSFAVIEIHVHCLCILIKQNPMGIHVRTRTQYPNGLNSEGLKKLRLRITVGVTLSRSLTLPKYLKLGHRIKYRIPLPKLVTYPYEKNIFERMKTK